MIIIHNKQLRELLTEKERLVTEGRGISRDIEEIEKEITEIQDKERKYTEECNPKELIAKGEKLKKKIETEIKKLEAIGEEIQTTKLAAIPKELLNKHKILKEKKEEQEIKRNKVALKVQKIKDRAIPIIQRETKPHLAEYDDINTAIVDGDKVVVETFNHLEEWKTQFAKNKK